MVKRIFFKVIVFPPINLFHTTLLRIIFRLLRLRLLLAERRLRGSSLCRPWPDRADRFLLFGCNGSSSFEFDNKLRDLTRTTSECVRNGYGTKM